MSKFGPGVLKIGETGEEFEASCLVNTCKITPSKNQTDPRTMLCGTQKAGKVEYTYELSGNIDLDDEEGADGFFALTQTAKGTELPFVFSSNTEAGVEASGVIVVDPLEYGNADSYGEPQNSDFTFAVVGEPVYDWGAGTPATGATAGTPGSWTPVGSVPPANLGATTGVTASPASAWTTGQHVITGDAVHCHWDGAAWATGDAA